MKFEYFTAEDWYECVADELVNPAAQWLDEGSGLTFCPNNLKLVKELAKRCEILLYCDSDSTLFFFWRFLQFLGLHYPEVCMLDIYGKLENRACF